MIRLTINNTHYRIPQSWQEITRKQLLYLVSLVSSEKCTATEIQLKFMLFCMQAVVKLSVTPGMYILKTKQASHTITPAELTALIHLFDYLFTTDQHGHSSISPQSMPNHFSRIRIRNKILEGPTQGLDNLTYNQFVWLQTYLAQITIDNSALDELINILYATKSGKHSISNVRRLPMPVKTAILWFVMGALAYLENMFPNVFSGSGSASGVINVFDNQQRIIDSLAEGDVTKKDKVRTSLLYDALYSMEMSAIRQQEHERQTRKK